MMRILFTALVSLITMSACTADEQVDHMADQLTESVVAECDGDTECLAEASKEFGDLADRAEEGARRTEQVLEDARRILDQYKDE